MTVDFRPPEERGESAGPREVVTRRGRQLVQVVLGAAATVMLVAGVAIWLTAPSFLSPEAVPWVAMALVLAGVGDALLAWGLGRWQAQRRQP